MTRAIILSFIRSLLAFALVIAPAAGCVGDDGAGDGDDDGSEGEGEDGACKRAGEACGDGDTCEGFDCECINDGCLDGPLVTTCDGGTCTSQADANDSCDVICGGCGGVAAATPTSC